MLFEWTLHGKMLTTTQYYQSERKTVRPHKPLDVTNFHTSHLIQIPRYRAQTNPCSGRRIRHHSILLQRHHNRLSHRSMGTTKVKAPFSSPSPLKTQKGNNTNVNAKQNDTYRSRRYSYRRDICSSHATLFPKHEKSSW
jgi:hypothetical protein